MQKLQLKLKDVPENAPQVLCSTNSVLNKQETVSVQDIVLDCNTPEVAKVQQTERSLKALVFVLNLQGIPLMPCSYAKSKRMVRNNKAKVVKLYPFTIQLNFECENQVQDVELGIDSGYGNIGFSCITRKKELASGTVVLDGKTSSRLTEKRMYRRLRRNKLWYRKPRFLNRKIKEGWLPPSIQRRYDTHLNLIRRLKAILPISKITIEVGQFDIQKIENQDISGVEYQQGDLYGYQNERSYLMAREKGLCQLCHKLFEKGNPSHTHHCKQQSEQGSNRVRNKAILHKKCHTKLHKKGLKLNAPKQYKASTFLSIINKKFRQDIPNVNITFGYITFVKRQELSLLKTHYNDAFVITGGNGQERITPIIIKQKHRNNRAIQLNRKGFAPAIRKQRYVIQPKDLIWIDGKKYVAKGIQNKGTYVRVENLKKVLKTNTIEKIYQFGSFLYN
ncbi:HNH endonuclease [Patescibacteria group bacterium]|uniref:Uncharacterized protein n=1 Tax=viral metagenome TaxID=1070528 RepID=A0A6M3M3J0_9ZZZZ|nr:HNH endonuclease [Patescibacteria group bacterium]MBU1067517.1 HNH endonuclease [Patescibacteria group bacterium]